MTAPRMTMLTSLHLQGTNAPNAWTVWHDDGTLSVLFDGGANQSLGFAGTPQKVRLALAKGLAAVDRAEKERAAAERAELAAADALEEPAAAGR